MKYLTRFIRGIAASLLLAVGLHGTAAKLDPITTDLGKSAPENSTTDPGILSTPPCFGGGNDSN